VGSWHHCFTNVDGVLATALANATTLEVVRLSPGHLYNSRNIEALLQAAPGLRRLEADMEMSPFEACTLLRRLPPFGPLQVLRAFVHGKVATSDQLTVIGEAVQKDKCIKALTLKALGVFDSGPNTFVPFLARLTSHPSLQSLAITNDPVGQHAEAAGTALGSLVGANSPALTALAIWQTGNLYDVGMAPILAALEMNSHLKMLKCNGNGASHAFARAHLLPAIQASNLRSLSAGKYGAMAAAQRFVSHRERERQAAIAADHSSIE